MPIQDQYFFAAQIINELEIQLKAQVSKDPKRQIIEQMGLAYLLLLVTDILQTLPIGDNEIRIRQIRNTLAHNKNLAFFEAEHSHAFRNLIADEILFYKKLTYPKAGLTESSEFSNYIEWQKTSSLSDKLHIKTHIPESQRLIAIPKLINLINTAQQSNNKSLLNTLGCIYALSFVGELTYTQDEQEKRQNALIEITRSNPQILETLAPIRAFRDIFMHPAQNFRALDWQTMKDEIILRFNHENNSHQETLHLEEIINHIHFYHEYYQRNRMAIEKQHQQLFPVLYEQNLPQDDKDMPAQTSSSTEDFLQKENRQLDIALMDNIRTIHKLLGLYQFFLDVESRLIETPPMYRKQSLTLFDLPNLTEMANKYFVVLGDQLNEITTSNDPKVINNIAHRFNQLTASSDPKVIANIRAIIEKISLDLSNQSKILTMNLFMIAAYFELPKLCANLPELIAAEKYLLKEYRNSISRKRPKNNKTRQPARHLNDTYLHHHLLLSYALFYALPAKIVRGIIDAGATINWHSGEGYTPHLFLLLNAFSIVNSHAERESYKELIIELMERAPKSFDWRLQVLRVYRLLASAGADVIAFIMDNKILPLEEVVQVSKNDKQNFFHWLLDNDPQLAIKLDGYFNLHTPITTQHVIGHAFDVMPVHQVSRVFISNVPDSTSKYGIIPAFVLCHLLKNSTLDVNAKTTDGNTALYLLSSGMGEEVKYIRHQQLIKFKTLSEHPQTDLNHLNARHGTPLSMAFLCGDHEKILILFNAAFMKGHEELRKLLTTKAIGHYATFCSMLVKSAIQNFKFDAPYVKKTTSRIKKFQEIIHDSRLKTDYYYQVKQLQECCATPICLTNFPKEINNYGKYLDYKVEQTKSSIHNFYGCDQTTVPSKIKQLVIFAVNLLNQIARLKKDIANSQSSQKEELEKQLASLLEKPFTEHWLEHNEKHHVSEVKSIEAFIRSLAISSSPRRSTINSPSRQQEADSEQACSSMASSSYASRHR